MFQQCKSTQKIHEKKCEHSFQVRYPEKGDSNSPQESDNQPTKRERQDRIEHLAKPNRRLLETTYETYKDLLPDEKAEKIKMAVDHMRPISME